MEGRREHVGSGTGYQPEKRITGHWRKEEKRNVLYQLETGGAMPKKAWYGKPERGN